MSEFKKDGGCIGGFAEKLNEDVLQFLLLEIIQPLDGETLKHHFFCQHSSLGLMRSYQNTDTNETCKHENGYKDTNGRLSMHVDTDVSFNMFILYITLHLT